MASAKEIKSSFFKKLVKKIFNIFNLEIKKKNNFGDRYSEFIVEANDKIKADLDKFEKICLASKLNLWSILSSIEYIKNKKINGDIVECGVYNGGTLAFIINIISKYSLDKKIWGYDTFEDGFLKDIIHDNDIDFKSRKKIIINNDSSYYHSIDEVKDIIKKNTFSDFKNLKLVKGNIIETLEKEKDLPDKISFLRMDTDLYLTTKKQLEVLYPRLESGGVLHIDDYGLCPGVKTAVDEYFVSKTIWLHRVDNTCRYLIKE